MRSGTVSVNHGRSSIVAVSPPVPDVAHGRASGVGGLGVMVHGIGDGCCAMAGKLYPPQHPFVAPPPHALQGMTSPITNLPQPPVVMSNLLLVPSFPDVMEGRTTTSSITMEVSIQNPSR
jgi:hypothetical protein